MRKILSMTFLLSLLTEAALGLLPSSPFAVQCVERGDSCLVIWYYQGVNQRSCLNDLGEVNQYFLVTTEDLDNRALARFEGVPSRYPVESISVYLWGTDQFPELPGGPLSPFGLSVHGDWPSDSDPDPLWGEDTVAAGLVPPGGAWHSFPVRELLPLQETTFVQFRWIAESPAAPLLVTDGSGDTLPDSFFGFRQGGSLTWRPIYAGNLLMRLNYCLPDTLPDLKGDFDKPDSFAVFVVDDSSEAFAAAFPYTVVPDSLHAMLPLAVTGGKFISVAAWHGDQLGPRSVPSRLPHFDILPFPLTIDPESLAIHLHAGQLEHEQVTLTNLSDAAVSFRLSLESDVDWLVVDSNATELTESASATCDLTFDATEKGAGAYSCWVEIRCLCYGRVFESYLYPISLEVDEYTGVDLTGIVGTSSLQLLQNFPNPFNASTLIMSPTSHDLTIFNLLGQRVATLHWRGQVSQGVHVFSWNGDDSAGRQLPSGIYFCVSTSGKKVLKILLLR
jgi:hypothetical protein